MNETINTKISELLETVDKCTNYLSDAAKNLFLEDKITFDQYNEIIKHVLAENNKIISEVCSVIKEIELKNLVSAKELEEKRIEHQFWFQEKQIELSAFNSCEPSKKILPNTPCVDIDSALTNKIITNRHEPSNIV